MVQPVEGQPVEGQPVEGQPGEEPQLVGERHDEALVSPANCKAAGLEPLASALSEACQARSPGARSP